MEHEQLKNEIRNYLKLNVFSGNLPTGFTDDSPLVSNRMMDSILTLKLISHFEELLNIEFKAHEVTVENLDSINILANFLSIKTKN
ncbi:MAG: hypothetical protein U0T74_13060 [Chitinophagales bacterium]